MALNRDFIEKIQDYRSRSAAAREAEENFLLNAMVDMGNCLGKMKAFESAGSDRFPVSVHSMTYSGDIADVDDGLIGAHVLVQRDGNKVSRVAMLIRTDKYEEEKIITVSPRRVESARSWKDETFRRSVDGVETSAQENTYNSAWQAAYILRSKLAQAVVKELSYGHSFMNGGIPNSDEEAAAVIKGLVQQALAAGADIERNRKAQKDERYRTSRALNGIWTSTRQDLSFLSELGFDFDDPERELSITVSSDISSLTIKTLHSFHYETSIKIEAMDNNPDIVLISLKNEDGRDETVSQFRVSDADGIKEAIKGHILEEIEAAEKVWVPEEELDHDLGPSLG